MLVQGVAIGRLTKRFKESHLILASVAVLAASLLAWAITPNVILLILVLTPLSIAIAILNTVVNSSISKSVYSEEVGGALGVSASLESLTRVIGPLVGAVLLDYLGPWAPGVIGAMIMVWLTNFVWRRLIVNPDPPLPPREEEATTSEAISFHP